MVESNLTTEPTELELKNDSLEFLITIEYPHIKKARKLDSIVYELSYYGLSNSSDDRSFTTLFTKSVLPTQKTGDSTRIQELVKSKVELKSSSSTLYIRTYIFKNGKTKRPKRFPIARIEGER